MQLKQASIVVATFVSVSESKSLRGRHLLSTNENQKDTRAHVATSAAKTAYRVFGDNSAQLEDEDRADFFIVWDDDEDAIDLENSEVGFPGVDTPYEELVEEGWIDGWLDDWDEDFSEGDDWDEDLSEGDTPYEELWDEEEKGENIVRITKCGHNVNSNNVYNMSSFNNTVKIHNDCDEDEPVTSHNSNNVVYIGSHNNQVTISNTGGSKSMTRKSRNGGRWSNPRQKRGGRRYQNQLRIRV
eukprot:g15117.t1 g15117   contig21:569893-570794(+)